MKNIVVIILVIAFNSNLHSLQACTSAIVSGKATPDGRPLMWKHRDTKNADNKLLYFSQGEYAYIGLVSVGKKERENVWMGMNEAGFCIMNTLSYNLNPPSEKESEGYSAGGIMARALATCADLEDFELLLQSLDEPTGLEANYGVIDAFGGAAYFEVGDHHLEKIDVNDPQIAPMGFAIRTNYSFTGIPDEGQGYARYIVANDLFYQNALKDNLTVDFILKQADRNLFNGFTKTDLRDYAGASGEVRMVHFQDNIARTSSTSSAIFKGVKEGDHPASTIMWTVLGWPLTSVAYPVRLNKDQLLPSILTGAEGETAPLCDWSLYLKEQSQPINRGHGSNYVDINSIYNTDGNGYLQLLSKLEDRILLKTRHYMATWEGKQPDAVSLKSFYEELNKMIRTHYHNNYQISYYSHFNSMIL